MPAGWYVELKKNEATRQPITIIGGVIKKVVQDGEFLGENTSKGGARPFIKTYRQNSLDCANSNKRADRFCANLFLIVK